MQATVIYHSADFDGIFCREIARKFLPDAELIGWDFADAPLKIPDGQIYVLDLPCDRPFGREISQVNMANASEEFFKRIIWIDHHKTSIDTHPPNIPGYRIDGVAACRLAWQYFHLNWQRDIVVEVPSKKMFVERKVQEPLAVRLAGEYDIWDKRDPRAEVFQFGLRSCDLSEWWKHLLESETDQSFFTVSKLLTNGELLQRYQRETDASIVKHKTWVQEWEGLKFLCLNTARFNSLTFMERDIPETGHDALLGFSFDGKGWTVSLYHARHRMDLDLSEIAKKHGGGGHRGACGFRCAELPFLPTKRL